MSCGHTYVEHIWHITAYHMTGYKNASTLTKEPGKYVPAVKFAWACNCMFVSCPDHAVAYIQTPTQEVFFK